MKNAFYSIVKAFFVLKIFNFLSWLFGHVEKTAWLERGGQFQNFYFTIWLTTNYNTHIAQYLKKWRQPDIKIVQAKEYNKRNIFLQNHADNDIGRLVPDLFLFF